MISHAQPPPNFRLRAARVPIPPITIISPNGGEVWVIGNVYPIMWAQSGVDTVSIEFSTNGPGGPWNLITPGVPASPITSLHPKMRVREMRKDEVNNNPSGVFNWLIPSNTTPSNNCYIRISQKSNPTISDLSNYAFVIIRSLPPDSLWVVQASGTTASLFAVKAVSPLIGWTGGAGGIVRRTTDGGNIWASAASVGADVYTLAATDHLTAIVGSYDVTSARLHKTSNGGLTWRTVDSVTGGFYNYVHMFDAVNGYAVGDPTPVGGNWVLKRTTNGGETWLNASTLPGPGTEAGWNNSMMWLDNTNGWFGTNTSTIYRTTDGGATWFPSPTNLGSPNCFAIQFNTLSIGLAGSELGTMNRSTNGGASWVSGPASLPYATVGMWGDQSSLLFWVAAGPNVYYSINYGSSWSTAGHGYSGTSVLNHLSMTGLPYFLHGWAVGDNGTIIRYYRITDAVEMSEDMPLRFELLQNYPNPFNPSTSFEFRISKSEFVSLKVYDLLGREVATLVNEHKEPGSYSVTFDASKLSGGVYFYRLHVSVYSKTMKLILMR